MALLNTAIIFKLLSGLASLWVANKAIRCIYYEVLKHKNGHVDPPKYPHKDPIWGLDLFFKIMSAFQSGHYLTTNSTLFKAFPSKTFKSNSFGTTVYRTYDPEVSKQFQSVHFKDFGIGPLRYHVAENLWGNGIVVSDGQKWADARSFIRSSFDIVHTANIDRLSWHVDRFMELLPRTGETVDLLPLFKRLILDTSSEFIFGESLNALENPDTAFMDSFEYAQRGTGIRAILGRLKIFHRDKKWLEACKQVTDFCDKCVDEALSRNEEGKERRTEHNRLRLVDEAAKATKDRYTLRSLILSVFSPAHDGAAVALSNAFFHLARSPRSVKCANRLAHRLTAIVNLNQRVCLNDVVLPCGGGVDGKNPIYFRKGDIIEVDYRTMMRDPTIWGADAEQYVPERWEKIRPTWEYTPFGGGPRACPGMRLVYTECAYTIVRILREFQALENRDEEFEWKEKMRLTMQSKNGTQVGLIPVA
ncbi:cytochrome P450 [Dendryphion nanum]|uniref:Cytochrome P450 n=1 Tax=Dendryphion nanum TaxID=256645 RepID=A0A9P9IK67_9PLEO|nr:cytochrome P450 [Dendryphion nanum]